MYYKTPPNGDYYGLPHEPVSEAPKKKRINPTSLHIPCSYPIGSVENPYNPAGNICTHEEFETQFVKNDGF